MSRSDARCATPYIYSGELQIRPEVDAALAALKDKPYTAIPRSVGGRREVPDDRAER